MQHYDIIVACANLNGIGNKGMIPWNVKDDMAYFKKMTTTTSQGKINGVIMGRRTWEGIDPKYRPLAGRKNVVVSKTMQSTDDLYVAKSFDEALEYLRKQPDVDKIFVCGGSAIYAEAIGREDCSKIYFTKIIEPSYECDVYFPEIDEKKFNITSKSEEKQQGVNKYQFIIYEKAM